jgi:HlyD family secretion protein
MKNRKTILRVIVISLIVIVAGYYGYKALYSTSNGQLKASGTIEAVEVNVAPEASGKITEVLVDEGQTVKAGDPLLHLDPTLLQQQRDVSAANLDTAVAGVQVALNALDVAKSQYQTSLETALAQDKQTRLKDWFVKDPKQFDQPGWYFSRDEQIQAAQTQVDDAKKVWDDAQANLTRVTNSIEKADFLNAENRLLNARLAYLIARDVNNKAQNSTSSDQPVGRYNSTHCGTNDGYRLANARLTNYIYTCNGDPQLSDAGQSQYDSAQTELDNAQKAYNDLLSTKAAEDVLTARAEVSVAQERYYSALDFLRSLQTGDQSPSVTTARDALDQAQASADQAEKAVAQAEANLNLLDAQLAKLTVYAPMDGVILSRNVEPGEFVQPGATALSMANLNNLTITVYVPEDRYGQIYLNQNANVSVDSFPGQTFKATVSYISDQAEFTPRNVQTVEGRSSTVYAIKLKVIDPEGKLKPGMPADVVFITK